MNKIQLTAVYDRFLLYLSVGFPSDEALAMAEGRWQEFNAGEQADHDREREEGWSK